MQYAQRLLATLPVTRAGLRAILAVLTAFGIVLATAGVAAMPLLNAGNIVEDYESGSACHPMARMVYPEGQSAPEYVMPVYETGFGVGVDSILLSWCSTAGEVLEDPTITLNVVEGKTVTPCSPASRPSSSVPLPPAASRRYSSQRTTSSRGCVRPPVIVAGRSVRRSSALHTPVER